MNTTNPVITCLSLVVVLFFLATSLHAGIIATRDKEADEPASSELQMARRRLRAEKLGLPTDVSGLISYIQESEPASPEDEDKLFWATCVLRDLAPEEGKPAFQHLIRYGCPCILAVRLAARHLSQENDPEAIALLTLIVKEGADKLCPPETDTLLRRTAEVDAAIDLANAGIDKGYECVEAGLLSDVRTERVRAVAGLQAFSRFTDKHPPQKIVDTLGALSSDPSVYVRWRAAHVLWALPEGYAEEARTAALKKFANDEYSPHLRGVRWLLERRGYPVEELE